MKRRQALQLLPLSAAGLTSRIRKAHSEMVQPEQQTSPEPLALQYTKKVRERLAWIRETQTEDLMEGAYAIARTIENKGQCWQVWDAGHTNTDLYPGRNGEPQ